MNVEEIRCHTVPDYRGGRIVIPGCWSAVIYGDDECTCPGSPNAIAMDRRYRAYLRLSEMRERRRARDAAGVGLVALPGAKPFRREGPFVRVPLRVVG